MGLDAYPYTAGSTVLGVPTLGGVERVLVTWSKPYPRFAGRDLEDIARELGCGREQAVRPLLPVGGIFFMMDEDDVRRVLTYPHTMIGSDGIPHDDHPHPRLWGTFTRILGYYVRKVGLLSLADAVRKMTILPAAHFGLDGRGTLVPNAFADIDVFDPETVIDRATYDRPTEPSDGIVSVLVNGRPVWRDGRSTEELPGQVLTRP